MIIVIQPGLLEALRLGLRQHTESDTGFHAEFLHRIDHLDHPVEVFIGRITPCRSHTKARRTTLPCGFCCTDHFIQRQQLLTLQGRITGSTL